ncbi:uncharacterized protein F5147DRAFT_552352, partial [Suillus discolor]
DSNRIVPASQDRCGQCIPPDLLTGNLVWKPTLALLRINCNRTTASVHWSTNKDKFTVASGA